MAISWISDECFTFGKTYECENTYGGSIDMLDDNKHLIRLALNDSDFTFILNSRDDLNITMK